MRSLRLAIISLTPYQSLQLSLAFRILQSQKEPLLKGLENPKHAYAFLVRPVGFRVFRRGDGFGVDGGGDEEDGGACDGCNLANSLSTSEGPFPTKPLWWPTGTRFSLETPGVHSVIGAKFNRHHCICPYRRTTVCRDKIRRVHSG